MATHDAIKIVRNQFDAHLSALDHASSAAERAVIYRNLGKHLKAWSRTLEKEAASQESLALNSVKRKLPKLEAA